MVEISLPGTKEGKEGEVKEEKKGGQGRKIMMACGKWQETVG